jgi:hypothetical protein
MKIYFNYKYKYIFKIYIICFNLLSSIIYSKKIFLVYFSKNNEFLIFICNLMKKNILFLN